MSDILYRAELHNPEQARAVLGVKPRRERSEGVPVKRDDRTADLFPAESRVAEWFASAPSLEMSP